MRTSRAPWLLLLLIASAPIALCDKALAQEALTLDAALREAREGNLSLQAADARVASLATEARVANTLPNPRLLLGSTVNYARLYGTLQFQFPIFGQLELAAHAAEAQADVTRRDADIAALDVALAVSLAWVDLWLAEREREASERIAERRARLEGIARERFDAGAASRLDVLRTHADAMRAQTDRDVRLHFVHAAQERLSAVLGRASMSTPLTFAVATSGEPLGASLPPLASLEARLVDHPRASRALQALRAAGSVIEREERRRFPMLGMELGANLFYAAGSDPSAHIAFSFEVPIFDLDAPLVTRAEAQRGVVLAEQSAMERDLMGQLRSAYHLAEAARERARALHHEVMPAMNEAADLAAASYEEGRLDVFGLIAAEQGRADTDLEVQRALAERGRAMAALTHAAGGLP